MFLIKNMYILFKNMMVFLSTGPYGSLIPIISQKQTK